MAPKVVPKKKAPSKPKSKISLPGPSNVVKSDAQWQAEDDARTLMRAEEIKRSMARLRKAQQVARQQADAARRIAKL